MTQFIAHAEEPRTFANKKGATAAIKRDLDKHWQNHGDVLFETGFDVRPAGDRFGVVLFCDLTDSSAHELVGTELSGYVIEPQLKEEPVKKAAPAKPASPKKSRRKGQISVAPMAPLIPCREGSKQQAIIDALATDNVWDQPIEYYPNGEDEPPVAGMSSIVGGATLEDLSKVCIKNDGVTPWEDNSIRSAMYYDLKDKGYGTRTLVDENGVHYYTLVLPEGYDAPLPPKKSKS